MPLVDHVRSRAGEDGAHVELGELACLGVVQADGARAVGARRPGFARPHGTGDLDRAESAQMSLDRAVDHPRKIARPVDFHGIP